MKTVPRFCENCNKHPVAAYTTENKFLCIACATITRSEDLFNKLMEDKMPGTPNNPPTDSSNVFVPLDPHEEKMAMINQAFDRFMDLQANQMRLQKEFIKDLLTTFSETFPTIIKTAVEAIAEAERTLNS